MDVIYLNKLIKKKDFKNLLSYLKYIQYFSLEELDTCEF